VVIVSSRLHATINGRQIKNPAVRAMIAVLGVMIAVGLVGLVMLVALPIALLGIGVAVVGSLAAAFVPRLRRRGRGEQPDGHLPRSPRKPRGPTNVRRVEPIAPPRNLD